MIGSLQAMGLAAGGLYVADRFCLMPGGACKPHVAGPPERHIVTPWLNQLVTWVKGDFPYTKGTPVEWYAEDLHAGLNVWGPISTDVNLPRWDLMRCEKVMSRWATIGEHAQLLVMTPGSGDPDAAGTTERILAELDRLRHDRNQLRVRIASDADGGDNVFDESIDKLAERAIRRMAEAIEREADFSTNDPDVGAGYWHFFGDELDERLDDLGDAAGAIGGAVGSLAGNVVAGAGGALFRSLATPLGAGALLVGVWYAHRKGWL